MRAIGNHFDLASMARFHLDGEQIIDLMHTFHEVALVAVATGALFEGPKTTNKRITDADVSTTVTIEQLKEIFKDHDATITHEAGTNRAQNIRKTATNGSLRVQ